MHNLFLRNIYHWYISGVCVCIYITCTHTKITEIKLLFSKNSRLGSQLVIRIVKVFFTTDSVQVSVVFNQKLSYM